MPDNPPDLTAEERDICARSGMSPEKYAAIRDTPVNFGGRSIADVSAAIRATDDQPKEAA